MGIQPSSRNLIKGSLKSLVSKALVQSGEKVSLRKKSAVRVVLCGLVLVPVFAVTQTQLPNLSCHQRSVFRTCCTNNNSREFKSGVASPADPLRALAHPNQDPRIVQGAVPKTVFRIGKKDRSYAEFKQHWRQTQSVVYEVGTSSPSRDWPAYQPGAFDYDCFLKHPNGIPYKIVFSLEAFPHGQFTLHLDAIFRYRERIAPPRYFVNVNGNSGSFQLHPRPAPSLWWPTGGGYVQFIGYESLDIQLPAMYFHQGKNTITVSCRDGLGIFYDDLSLTNEPYKNTPIVTSASVNPTIFYKRDRSELDELGEVRICTSRPLSNTRLKILIGKNEFVRTVSQKHFGDLQVILQVPQVHTSVGDAIFLNGVKRPLCRGVFDPSRYWKIYAMPSAQADFGYDAVPARTLAWEDRYIDKALEIEKEFPSYSFTLDASANLQSYLDSRDDAHRQQLLNYLRNGKFGLNALYENFFTGLATPEELFRELHYGLLVGQKYDLCVDSASQTDEPTVTWAIPQVLASSGVKYFSIGSDPYRAPFNPIGHFNLKSPFYWEGPDGSKVLMWMSVSYTVLDDLDWGGWNPVAARAHNLPGPERRYGDWHWDHRDWNFITKGYVASLYGLRRSLPLFLSQYRQYGYPFDAVLLYGLKEDEFPILHYASADIIAKWNKEFAYPRIIAAPQRDFFKYISSHFNRQIPVHRGDQGTYWEDEAGSDARDTRKNRVSQMQIAAAEKLDSFAEWIQPLIQFNFAKFRRAWEHIMLSDDYVLSDRWSFDRPDSMRTRYEEDVHRGYTSAAYRETRDLLTVAMDRIGDLINTNRKGVTVFNLTSQPRSGLFTFDVKPGRTLADPANGQRLPCGVFRRSYGYQTIRCWSQDVPAMGYKFYDIVKGKIASTRPVPIKSSSLSIDGRYYRLLLDPTTGGVAKLVDKSTGRELVNQRSAYQLNEYLYVSGGDPSRYSSSGYNNRLLAANPMLPLPKLIVHQPRLVGRPTVQCFPWGVVVRIHSRATNSPEIISRITLSSEEKLVAFDDQVQEIPTLKKEGVYFAFPFAVQKPRLEYQGATAWVNPETDMLPGANVQWFTTQGGVSVQGVHQHIGWVSVDAPLITLNHINRGLWPASIKIQNGTVFSYVMNNYWNTDAPAQQGGSYTFHYAITSGANLSLASLMNFTDKMRSPLYVSRRYYKGWKGVLPKNGTGFVVVQPKGALILTVHPLHESNLYLIRVFNATSQTLPTRVGFPWVSITDAYVESALREERLPLRSTHHEIRLVLGAHAICSLLIHVARNR